LDWGGDRSNAGAVNYGKSDREKEPERRSKLRKRETKPIAVGNGEGSKERRGREEEVKSGCRVAVRGCFGGGKTTSIQRDR